MAVSFVAAGTVVAAVNPVVTVPAGYAAGDMLILFSEGTTVPATPSGWSVIASTASGLFPAVFYKFASASEASVTLTGPALKAVMLCYRGAYAIDAISTLSTGTGTSATSPSVTTTQANTYVLRYFLNGLNASTITAPAGTTQRVNSASTAAQYALLVTDEAQAAAGASGTKSATISASKAWAAYTFAISPTSNSRYWVGGTGTWDTSTTTNWGYSSGAPGGATAPTSSNPVIFDANSGSGTVTISGAVCSTLTRAALTQTWAFGSSSITCYGSGTSFNVAGTLLTVTGTPTINISNNSATATTITPSGSFTEANAFAINITTGTYALTVGITFAFKSLNFTGFTGTWAPGSLAGTFYGSLTMSSGMTFTTGNGIWSFNNTSGTATITSAGKTLGPITQSGAGGTLTFAANTTTAAFTFTSGTLDLANTTLSCTTFSSANTNVRVIAFGTGNITTTGTGTTLNVTGTNLTYTGTPTVNVNNNTATALGITLPSFTSSNAFNVNIVSGTYALTEAASNVYNSLNYTGFAGTVANSVKTIYGNLTIASGATYTAGANGTTFGATSGTQTLTSNGQTLDFPIATTSGGTFTLADTFSQGTTRAFFVGGTVDINFKTNTFGILTISTYPTVVNGTLNATSTNQNGAGQTVTLPTSSTINLGSSYTLTGGTLDLATNSVNLSIPSFISPAGVSRAIAFGTSTITVTGSGTVINMAGTTFGRTGTATINVSNNSATAATVTATGFSLTNALNFNFTTGTYALTIATTSVFNSLDFTGFAGSYAGTSALTIYRDFTVPATMSYTSTGTLTFSANGANQIITTNGVTLSASITQSNPATIAINGNLTLSTTSTYTLSLGTLDLTNGGAGNYNLSTGSFVSSVVAARVIAFGTGNITTTGSGVALNINGGNLTYTGTPTVNVSNNTATATTVTLATFNATNALDVDITTGTYTLTITSASFFKSLDFTGFTGTWAPGTANATFYGSLTIPSGMTFTAGTGAWSFNNTSGTAVIKSAGKTLNPITQGGAGGTVALAEDTRLNGSYNLNSGNIDLTNGGIGNYVLTVTTITSTASSVRLFTFGTGNITLTGSGTVFNVNGLNLTYTGTPTINVNNNSAINSNIGASSGWVETNAFNFNITTGTYVLTTTNTIFKNLNLTGFAGTLANSARTIYGALTLPATVTYAAGANTTTFAATSGTQTFTTNNVITDFPITKIGAGTLLLVGNLNMNTTRTLTLTEGTFDANGYNVQPGLFSSNNTNVRTLTMGSGLWNISGVGSVWDLTTTTNLTFNKGSANIILSSASTTASTFAGGGLTYNALTIGGSGIAVLNITGSNTFSTLASTKANAYTLNLESGTTTTVTTFGITGTAGNVLTLKASTAGSQATLSQATGTVSVSYMNITDSNATGGAAWQAYLTNNNVDGGNNTGWLFAPGNSSNFFLLF